MAGVDEMDLTEAPPITDDELTQQALAAAGQGVAADAVPLSEFLGSEERPELLPDWYMPPPMGAGRLLQGWRRRIVLLIVVSFVLINAVGLCSTYGSVGFD